jgi:hypothetical protein
MAASEAVIRFDRGVRARREAPVTAKLIASTWWPRPASRVANGAQLALSSNALGVPTGELLWTLLTSGLRGGHAASVRRVDVAHGNGHKGARRWLGKK